MDQYYSLKTESKNEYVIKNPTFEDNYLEGEYYSFRLKNINKGVICSIDEIVNFNLTNAPQSVNYFEKNYTFKELEDGKLYEISVAKNYQINKKVVVFSGILYYVDIIGENSKLYSDGLFKKV